MAIVKNEMGPAFKKAGLSFAVRRARFGAPSNEFYIAIRAANWEEAGIGGMQKVMGAEAYETTVAKLTPLTTTLETNLYK